MWHKNQFSLLWGRIDFLLTEVSYQENIWMIPMMMVIALAVFPLWFYSFVDLFFCFVVCLFFVFHRQILRKETIIFNILCALKIYLFGAFLKNKKRVVYHDSFSWCQWEQLHQVSNCSRPDRH